MSQSQSSARVTVASYGFNVPCRRFLVTSNIAQDRRLPVVDEFVLRALKIAEHLPVTKLAAFLGFSMFEAGVVIEDLKDRGLVRVDGDNLELAPLALDHFRFGRDGAPEIVEVETWVDKLWFDLISKNMMAPDRTKPFENLFDLDSRVEFKEMPESFARQAFEQNFQDFLRKVRKLSNIEKYNLYSISDVLPDRFGMVALHGSMELQTEPEPRLVPRFLDLDFEERAKYAPLTEAMQDAVRRASEPEPSTAGFAEFRRLVADSAMPNAHDGVQFISPTVWLSEGNSDGREGRQPIIGSSYLDRNVGAFCRAIARGASRFQGQRARMLKMNWYRPAGSAWGTSLDLQRAVQEFTGAVAKALSPSWRISSNLIVPAIARHEAARRFSRIFGRGLLSPPNHLPGGIEVVSIEGVAAMVLTRAAISRNVAIPVGMVVSNDADVRRIENGLKLELLDEGGLQRLWSTKAPGEEDSLEDREMTAQQ